MQKVLKLEFELEIKLGKKDTKGKNEIKEEEKKEEPPLDTVLQKACDIVYLLSDYPTTEVSTSHSES